jgi:hypothetical protein
MRDESRSRSPGRSVLDLARHDRLDDHVDDDIVAR